MDEMPEEFYERLAAAFAQTLFRSDLMQDAISDINDQGYEISLGLWAKGAKAGCESTSVCERQLGLFDGEPKPMPGQPQFEVYLTAEDAQFLRSIGVTEAS